jgi:Cytochrome C and Quinol oxidase polypeptide I
MPRAGHVSAPHAAFYLDGIRHQHPDDLRLPALTVACGMLALDRTFGMHFFTNAMGGNMMNYINLFWLWGHPEVYILILPAFGVFSEVAAFSQKRLFGYISPVLATVAIGLLSFTCGCITSSPWAPVLTSMRSSAS